VIKILFLIKKTYRSDNSLTSGERQLTTIKIKFSLAEKSSFFDARF